jgi:hypothetical protein
MTTVSTMLPALTPTAHRAVARLAAAAAAMALIAGCGDDRSDGAERASTAAPSMAAYTDQVTGVHDAFYEVQKRYLHGPRGRAERRTGLERLQAALAEAAQDMQALEPPAQATAVHTRLARVFERSAAQLGKALHRRPFDLARAHLVVMAAHEREGMAYGDIFTVPR